MNLTIDIGNTSVKAAVFEGEQLVEAQRLDYDFREQLALLVRKYAPRHCAFANVAGRHEAVQALLESFSFEIVELSWETPVSSFGLSAVPAGLGADRLAAVLGAMWLCPRQPLLVVDAGTCLTYDYVSSQGEYLGGNISPGLALRLRAMHEHTALLPLVSLSGEAPLVGHDTATALRSGVVHGACFEIEGFWRADVERRGEVTLLFAGADPLPFSADTKEHMVCEPRLVSIGLNCFLRGIFSEK